MPRIGHPGDFRPGILGYRTVAPHIASRRRHTRRGGRRTTGRCAQTRHVWRPGFGIAPDHPRDGVQRPSVRFSRRVRARFRSLPISRFVFRLQAHRYRPHDARVRPVRSPAVLESERCPRRRVPRPDQPGCAIYRDGRRASARRRAAPVAVRDPRVFDRGPAIPGVLATILRSASTEHRIIGRDRFRRQCRVGAQPLLP